MVNSNTPIGNLELPIQVYNAFVREGIETVGDLESMTAAQLLRIPNFGRTYLARVEAELARHGGRLAPAPGAASGKRIYSSTIFSTSFDDWGVTCSNAEPIDRRTSLARIAVALERIAASLEGKGTTHERQKKEASTLASAS